MTLRACQERQTSGCCPIPQPPSCPAYNLGARSRTATRSGDSLSTTRIRSSDGAGACSRCLLAGALEVSEPDVERLGSRRCAKHDHRARVPPGRRARCDHPPGVRASFGAQRQRHRSGGFLPRGSRSSRRHAVSMLTELELESDARVVATRCRLMHNLAMAGDGAPR